MSLNYCNIITARNEVGARLCFYTCLRFCSRGWGWWYPSMPCSRSPRVGWGWYHSMPCGSPGPQPGRKLRGLAWGGGFQAHTWEGASRPTVGVSRPTPRGSKGPHPEGSPGPHLGEGDIPACTEADPPMATAAGGTHPTGMHSC